MLIILIRKHQNNSNNNFFTKNRHVRQLTPVYERYINTYPQISIVRTIKMPTAALLISFAFLRIHSILAKHNQLSAQGLSLLIPLTLSTAKEFQAIF